MNINHMTEHPTAREVRYTLGFFNNKLCQQVKRKISMEKALDIAKWLVQPESEDDLPQFGSRKVNNWGSAGKTFFWIAISISISFLIAQLSG